MCVVIKIYVIDDLYRTQMRMPKSHVFNCIYTRYMKIFCPRTLVLSLIVSYGLYCVNIIYLSSKAMATSSAMYIIEYLIKFLWEFSPWSPFDIEESEKHKIKLVWPNYCYDIAHNYTQIHTQEA